MYLFSYVRTANRGKVRGAAHGDELAFVFDNWEKAYPSLQLSDEDRAATRRMHECWINFAKTGKPSSSDMPDWPRYSRDTDLLMDLGVTPVVRKEFRRKQLDAQESAMQDTLDRGKQSIETLLLNLKNPEFERRK